MVRCIFFSKHNYFHDCVLADLLPAFDYIIAKLTLAYILSSNYFLLNTEITIKDKVLVIILYYR